MHRQTQLLSPAFLTCVQKSTLSSTLRRIGEEIYKPAMHVGYLRVVLEAKTDNLFSSISLLLHPMAKTHHLLIWRQVGPFSGAKTCTHASSRHFSLWKHSHRVSVWLATSSYHKTDFIYHFIPSVDCLAHVFDILRQDLKEDIVSFPQP